MIYLDNKITDLRIQDLIGSRYGQLKVIAFSCRENKVTKWLCLCDCGKEKIIRSGDLKNGRTKSCGCLQIKMAKKANTTHGCSRRTPEYDAWATMIKRCTNPKNNYYHRYGGRGISVCDRWLKFENFLADMGEKPSKDHSIDRINNDGDYKSSNCKWSTRKEQANNRATNHYLIYLGRTLTVAQWAEELGIKRTLIYGRIYNGLPLERVLAR